MNWEMIKGAAERVIYILVLWLVSKDIIPETMVADVTLAIGSVLAVVWGLAVNRQSSLIKAAASMPEVKKVVVTEKVDAGALSAPGAQVTKS